MKKVIKILAVVLAVAMTLGALVGCKNSDVHTCGHKCEKCGLCTDKNCTDKVCGNKCKGHDDITDLTVRDYVGQNGIVTAANPYAANAGLQVLKDGGNAFDAAVAVSFALGVAECDATGLGGGGLMIAYNTNTKQSLFYNFREFAPANVPTEASYYTNSKGNVAIGDKYTKVTAVPTQVAGLLTILEEQGTLTRAEVMKPAIDLANNGVVVTPELANNISNNVDKILRSSDEVGEVFLHFGLDPFEVGDTIVQPQLAETLQYVSDNGKEGFYTGEIAQKVVDAAQKYGSKMTLDDLTYAMNNYPRKDSQVISGSYKGYDLLTCSSPSTGGVMVLEMLNMLENYGDVKSLGHNSVEYINLLATVEQLAYGDKEKYLADTNFPGVTDYKSGLLNKAYAAERIQKYTAGKAYLGTATGDNPYGDPSKYMASAVTSSYGEGYSDSHYSTTSFSIIDKDGNIVTVTQTINNFFGTGIVPEGLGFFLNDEMRDFTLADPTSINAVAPHKQPASYMAPTVILKDGQPYATLGTPGGSRIPSALLQVILNMIEFDMDMQTAINQPRCCCFATTASNKNNTTKSILLENGLSGIGQALTGFGYAIEWQGSEEIDSYLGGVQGIKVESQGYHGGADPRRDGKAFGY